MKYNGKDREVHVSLNIITPGPTRSINGPNRQVVPMIYIGNLCIELDIENATKLWDDLGTKLEEIADPNSDCWTKSFEEIFNGYTR